MRSCLYVPANSRPRTGRHGRHAQEDTRARMQPHRDATREERRARVTGVPRWLFALNVPGEMKRGVLRYLLHMVRGSKSSAIPGFSLMFLIMILLVYSLKV